MENKNNRLVIILLIVIAILCGIIGFVLGNKSENKNDNDKVSEKTEEIKKYTAYKQGEEIKLSDNSEWMVLKDSDENSDYVVLLSKKEYNVTDNFYNSIENEIFNNKDTQYDNSSIKQFINSLESQIPVELKNIDGYKIRLITIDEIFAFDNNWNYDSNNDTYTYTGTNLNEYFRGITMTHTKCTEGKCTPFYILGETQCLEEPCNKEQFISHWTMDVGVFYPVINAAKDSLNK